ncbi:MAG TPA: phosphoribosylaminoimidazolesuccinocarboxamide synthase [Bdellovibrionales bacterium]|nr:phosphoribosylaminoimidazolesuccinocarboxamide synthase [Bdellovibrionales bacterium]
MNIRKGAMIYEGKAKKLYELQGEPNFLLQEFKDSLTAFNGEKKGSFADKGVLNRDMTSLIFQYLGTRGVPNHWVQDVEKREMVTEKLTIIPLEVVVRNRAAGSLAKKFKWDEGKELPFTLIELYYKSDEMGDPFINDEHVRILGLCTAEELARVKEMALKINGYLKSFFGEAGLDLVDFKLEFGRDSKGQIKLGDEITPDSCRLWDRKTGEKMDKDRFRRDLGNVQQTYEEVCRRLTAAWRNLK